MALIGNDFKLEPTPYMFRCDCGKKVKRGELPQVSRRFGKVQKRLCESEDCRLEFDDRFWQEQARKRSRRKP